MTETARDGATAGSPARRDGTHSRSRIVAAARELFVERGLDVGLNEVAHRAGVGVGTVYRRFPSADLLVDEVFTQRADDIVAIADRAAGNPDSWAGLVEFMESVNTYVDADRGLRDVMLHTGRLANSVTEIRSRLAPAVESLLSRAKADGYIRPDVQRADLVLVDVMVDAARRYTADFDPDQWRRCLALALDGLRPRSADAAPLPGQAMSPALLEAAMRSARKTR